MNLKEIASEFGIEFSNAVKPENAALAKVFILDDKYVLRSREPDLKKFKREQETLSKINIPYNIPELLLTKNGKKYFLDKELWTMHKKLPGQDMGDWRELQKITDKELHYLIGVLKEIHNRTKDMNTTSNFISDIKEIYQDVKKEVGHKKIEEALGRLKTPKKGCFIHGDFHPGNVLVENGKITGLIDLDRCTIGHPLEDLAFTIMMFLSDFSKPFDFNKEKMNKILQIYGYDGELVWDYLLLYVLFDVYTFKHASNLENRKFYYDFQVEFLNYMLENNKP